MFKGVFLPDGTARVDRAALMPGKRKYVVILEIHSGKKHIIRRLFRHFGYDVRALDRISYAGLNKKGLPVGKWRPLTDREIESLQAMASKAAATAPKPRKGTSGRKTKSRFEGKTRDGASRDYRSKSRGGKTGDDKRSSYVSRGERVERPELRRKKELIIGTEEWFAQDDVKAHMRRSDARVPVRTREDEDARPRTSKKDFGAPEANYTPKRKTRAHGDRQERASWREKPESSFDVESWFNESEEVSSVAKPRSRSKPTSVGSRSKSGSKPKSIVRTKPAHIRTKPGGGGKPKSRTGAKPKARTGAKRKK